MNISLNHNNICHCRIQKNGPWKFVSAKIGNLPLMFPNIDYREEVLLRCKLVFESFNKVLYIYNFIKGFKKLI